MNTLNDFSPSKSLFLFLCSNHQYASYNQATGDITCNFYSRVFSDAQVFELVNVTGNSVAIKTYDGRYCALEDKQIVLLKCVYEQVDDSFGLFKLTESVNNMYSFECPNGKWLSSENGEKPISCRPEVRKDWEKFGYSNVYKVGR